MAIPLEPGTVEIPTANGAMGEDAGLYANLKQPPEIIEGLPHEGQIPAIGAITPPSVQPASPWQVRTFSDAMRGDGSKPPWVIQDLLLDQTATLVSAQPHAMKSLSWLAGCIEAVAFHRVWGHFDASSVERALFIETEDPSWMVEARIRGIAKGLHVSHDNPLPGFYYVCPGPFDLIGEPEKLRGLLEQYRPDFAVISTLQNLLNGRSWVNQEDMQPVMAAILGLARNHCPIVLITHSPWDKRQRRAAGTVTQTANFITTMHYEKVQNQKTGETFAHVLMDSKAGAVEGTFHFRLMTEGDKADPESVRGIVYEGPGYPKGIGKATVLAAIEDDPEATPQEVAKRTGFSVRYVQKIIKECNPHGRK